MVRGSLRVMSDMRLAGPHNATAVYEGPDHWLDRL